MQNSKHNLQIYCSKQESQQIKKDKAVENWYDIYSQKESVYLTFSYHLICRKSFL